MNKTALLVGASGLVGSHCLEQLIQHDEYSTIHLFVRKKIEGLDAKKVEQHIVNFDDLPTYDFNQKLDSIFCCLGSTIKKAGSQAAFEKVDYTYVLETAKFGLKHGATQFLVITAIGADSSSHFFYNRVKGKVEEELNKLDYDSLLIFRPSMLGGKREEFRLGEKIGTFFMRLFQPFFIGKLKRYAIISGEKVAKSMVKNSLKKHQVVRIVESEEMH